MTDQSTPPRARRRSLIELLSDVPRLVSELVTAEIEQLKAEMTAKLKALGIGGGLIAAAAVVLLFMVGVLLTAAVLALALVMPGWAAALIVAGVLLIVAAILGWIGYTKLKSGIPPMPEATIESVKRDVDVVRGIRRPWSS
ncbi:phage holin family protein [Salinibacterium sp. dk2585]|uniref:phage holin family protein n=1 Tax=unclassified Salinibacterium TaxID=2632331 RepID=UPI0011C24E8C|nr:MULTISPECIES: phage holin family protein [unclassified Salinibacterium]QEE62434.1 phage holin family protein [Salinibacterium sp. dk2585]TXK52683.1 phage holin family protein [Salinibacterium sp. dk5596]